MSERVGVRIEIEPDLYESLTEAVHAGENEADGNEILSDAIKLSGAQEILEDYLEAYAQDHKVTEAQRLRERARMLEEEADIRSDSARQLRERAQALEEAEGAP